LSVIIGNLNKIFCLIFVNYHNDFFYKAHNHDYKKR